MALQRDFLMRMIQRLADAFARIVTGKALEDPQQALLEIEDLVADAMGTEAHFVLGQGAEAIEMLEPSLATQVGRLLLLHAKLADELGRDSTRSRTMGFRALQIALRRPRADFATLAASQLREHFDRLGRIADTPALAATALAAHEVHRHRGQWADAEDWLFFAVELEPGEATLSAGEAFFDELDGQSDDDLLKGGLSREEVAQSRADLLAATS